MAADDLPDVAPKSDEPEGPVLRSDVHKSYAKGYLRGLNELWDLIKLHGPFACGDLYEHCLKLYDNLREWEQGDDESDPPELPNYAPQRV